MPNDLAAIGRLHLAIHNAGSAVVAGWQNVGLRTQADHVVVTTDKRDVHVPAADRWLHYRWGWDKRVARLFRHFSIGDKINVKSGDQVIDIGANVGEFSLGVSALGAQSLALEGDPTVFTCLQANIAGTEIIARQALVWKCAEELTFYSAPAKADSSVFAPTKDQNVTEMRLPAQPLDELSKDLDSIALIKCDAEGAEPEVLEGARETLARTRQIAIDTGPERQGAETSDDCEAILKGHGFDVSHSTKGRKITFGVRS